MKEGQDMKRLREVAVALLGAEKGSLFSNLVSQLNLVGMASAPSGRPKPSWAENLSDHRHLLKWDATQYVGHVGINGKLVYCIVDIGGRCTPYHHSYKDGGCIGVKGPPGSDVW